MKYYFKNMNELNIKIPFIVEVVEINSMIKNYQNLNNY